MIGKDQQVLIDAYSDTIVQYIDNHQQSNNTTITSSSDNSQERHTLQIQWGDDRSLRKEQGEGRKD